MHTLYLHMYTLYLHMYTRQDYWPMNQLIYAALVQDTKKVKKILKKEKINLDMKDNSVIDDEGYQVQLTLLGEPIRVVVTKLKTV